MMNYNDYVKGSCAILGAEVFLLDDFLEEETDDLRFLCGEDLSEARKELQEELSSIRTDPSRLEDIISFCDEVVAKEGLPPTERILIPTQELPKVVSGAKAAGITIRGLDSLGRPSSFAVDPSFKEEGAWDIHPVRDIMKDLDPDEIVDWLADREICPKSLHETYQFWLDIARARKDQIREREAEDNQKAEHELLLEWKRSAIPGFSAW